MGNYRGFGSPHAYFVGSWLCVFHHANGQSVRRRFRRVGCRFVPFRYPAPPGVSALHSALGNSFPHTSIWNNCMESRFYVIHTHGHIPLFFMEECVAVDKKSALVFHRSYSLRNIISRLASCNRSGSIWIIFTLFCSTSLSIAQLV